MPRSRQEDCTIFVNLEPMLQIAHRVHASTMGPYEKVISELICQQCEVSPSAGDFCSERASVHCPLPRYACEIIELIEKLPVHNTTD